ncbi:hypothetical protein OS493_013075 [Desmophyllum pertusum]|uniref:Death domain-containing protein n=1 Tax=Desmophyllum pertusum TaxID=174260 RepID=A0A9X0CN35_9CNID|nr:hypothetical protein OS493_013075 [Desmophyllum pertusum]
MKCCRVSGAKRQLIKLWVREVKRGLIPLEHVPYLAWDILLANGDWKSVGRRLGLGDGQLNCIESDHDEKYEKCFKMLKTCQQSGKASYENVADVLKKHNLNATRESYCLEGRDPPTKTTVALGNVKPGCVQDLQSIANAVKGKRKRLGRALGLEDNDVEQIVDENRGKIYEQSYQILQKWCQAYGHEATYSVLAQALNDRTVNMGTVAATFCLA